MERQVSNCRFNLGELDQTIVDCVTSASWK
jgi:hypothetical protein